MALPIGPSTCVVDPYRGGDFFTIEVIFFPRGAPRGGNPQGGSGELFGLPTWRKDLRIRPWGYFFMLRSILILLDLEIPLKIQKFINNEFINNRIFQILTKS